MPNFITKEEVKTLLRIEDSAYDELITSLCNGVESLWDELTERIWFRTTHTEYHDSESRNSKVFLENYPVVSVTSLYDDPDWVFGSSSLIAAADYTTNLKNGIIHYDGGFYTGNQSIKVVYIAGYTSGAAPDWFKELLKRQICHWYEQSKGKRWAVSTEAQPGGGNISYKALKDNLLPDFVMVAEREKR